MCKATFADALLMTDKAGISSIDASEAPDIGQIASFKNLKSLKLTGNRGITDFSFLQQLPDLEELYLANMGLQEIPRQVESLKKLTTLFIGGNTISDFSIVPKLRSLSDLGIEEMGLRKVPEDVLKAKGLTVLGMTKNNIGSIDCLKLLPDLEEVYVANNNLHKIPKELSALKKLRLLAIAYNYSLSNWDELRNLTQLEELVLSNSHESKTLPDFIFGLENLKRLSIDIHWNAPPDKLEGSSSIGKLKQLEDLTIEGSSMNKLPDAFGNLKRLKKLDLKENKKLKNIAALKDLPLLEELDLTECAIEELPESFGTLTALKRLNLSKCKLKALPESFERLKKLESLELSHNEPLEDVSGLKNLPALERLTMYSNLRQLPRTLETLTGLRVLELSAKATDVSFLAKLNALEELYLAECSFDELPASLSGLTKLTIDRKKRRGKNDAFIQAYTRLEELSVSQDAFTLPVLPALRKLSVGAIVSTLDLTALTKMKGETLKELQIHRSDHLQALPREIASAKGLESITVEFLEKLTDVSGINNLPRLRRLNIQYCDKLAKLPAEFASLGGLEELELANLESMEDITVVGDLGNLTHLCMEHVEKVTKLPDSFSRLMKLQSLEMRRLNEVKDISVLKGLPALTGFDCEDCDGLKQRQIGEVTATIAARVSGGVRLKMSYQQFIDSGHYKRLNGKEDAKASNYGFPWMFGPPRKLLEALEDFSWLDDHRDSDSPIGEIIGNPKHHIKPLAVLDFGYAGCEDVNVDAYQEEFLVVDTLNPLNPVYVCGHDATSPSKLHDSFDDFLASLRDFRSKEDGEDGSDDAGDEPRKGDAGDESKNVIYLEYRDKKSSKFWQIEVLGNKHTVTYGKIGTAGSSLTKEFASNAAALKDAQKQIDGKLSKGYELKPD